MTTSLEPVEIEVRRDHPYKSRGKGKNGCGHLMGDGKPCMKAKTWRGHLGLPLSLNVFVSSGGWQEYNGLKRGWEELICEALELSGLPAGWREDAPGGTPQVQAIGVEGVVCFPIKRSSRDQGNFRWFLEKCLGDALDKGWGYSTGAKSKGTYEWHQMNPGGWIEDDCVYPRRVFDFGNLEIIYAKDEAWTRMVLFPRL